MGLRDLGAGVATSDERGTPGPRLLRRFQSPPKQRSESPTHPSVQGQGLVLASSEATKSPGTRATALPSRSPGTDGKAGPEGPPFGTSRTMWGKGFTACRTGCGGGCYTLTDVPAEAWGA